jgi:hypothetical protein
MAEELYHAFTVIHGLLYRVMVIAEQRVGDQWLTISQTELSTFLPRNQRTPRMPQRPPPPPPPASDDQVVPSAPPVELPQPSSDAPGPMRVERRTPGTKEEDSAPQTSQSPLARQGPDHHDLIVPARGVLATDIWFACPICTKTPVHSGVACGQCGGRPACCRCMVFLELEWHTEGRCPFCRYQGPL